MKAAGAITAAVLLAAALSARASGAQETGQNADTVSIDRIKPTWKSFMTAGVTMMSLGSGMEAVVAPGGGWRLSSGIRIERTSYRGRDIKEIRESFLNNASKGAPGIYLLGLSVGETYTRKKTLGLARFGKEIVYDDENAAFSFQYLKPFMRATSSQIAVSGNANRGLKDFKYVKNLRGEASGSVTYRIRDVLKLRGGIGAASKRDESRVGTIEFKGLPSNTDTLLVSVDFGGARDKLIEMEYKRMSGIERRIDPPRGNSREILDDPGKAQREEIRRKTELVEWRSYLKPLDFFSMKFAFDHSRRSQKYKADPRLSKLTESSRLSASSSYSYSDRGEMTVDVTNSSEDNDFGPLSTASYEEKTRKVVLNISHEVNDSLSIRMSGTASLKQRLYKKRDANPQDSDILFYKGNLNLRASPFPRIMANVVITVDRFERINIDRTLSADNRVDYLYRVAPQITVKPARWLKISQDYNVKIEFNDFIYTEEKNFLNRTTSLNTNADFIIFRPLKFSFRHRYLMKDSGSYLMRGGERLYSRSSENLEQSLFLDVYYEPKRDLKFEVETEFRNHTVNRIGIKNDGRRGVVGSTLYESGGLKLGFVRRQNIGSTGKIDLDIAYVKRFGPNVSPEKKEYWKINSGLTFNF